MLVPLGWPRSSTIAQMNVYSFLKKKGLYEFLKEQLFAYRDKVQSFIYDEYNIAVSVSTISRARNSAKIS